MKREELNFLLQQVDREKLKKLADKIREEKPVNVISAPSQQTVMVPVKDTVAGTGFYTGEVLVTQCLVQVEEEKGWAMVMDYEPELALDIALLDACFASSFRVQDITDIALEGMENYRKKMEQEKEYTASTKVNFDLMADMSGNNI